MILNEIVSKRINEQIPILEESGDLLSNEKLAEYYQIFKQKFGPGKLSSLDGEALLTTMHDSSNRNSLVYWLEFKNDEEMPNRFGSIAGGSALKFGIYKRSDSGNWMSGLPQKQVILSLEEAIQIARKHRDQLLAGIKLLEVLPENASNEEYAELQTHMTEIAPDMSDTAWGHKYFFMIFPSKLAFGPRFSSQACSEPSI
jgi:5-methylcytosine-specific restriction protein B